MMTESTIEKKEMVYSAANSVQRGFLQNSKFCLNLQTYARRLLAISIVIIPQRSYDDDWTTEKSYDGCTIQFPDTANNRDELEQIMTDLIRTLFQSIQSRVFANAKVKKWFGYPSKASDLLRCLEKIFNEKVPQVFTVCEGEQGKALSVYFLSSEPFDACNGAEIESIISEKISHETIVFPLDYEQSNVLKDELTKVIDESMKKEDIFVKFVSDQFRSVRKQQTEIVLFGYCTTVNRLKEEILKMREKYRLLKWKFPSIGQFQIDFGCQSWIGELREIQVKYAEMGVKFHLRKNEFQAPEYLKKEIESGIKKLIPDSSTTTTFTSAPLSKDIAQSVDKRLKTMARKYPCGIHTEFEYQSRSSILPKADSSNIQSSKLILEQSDHFYRSTEVSQGVMVNNGSIEIRTGDIALQKVDAMVISTTSNGLKESVIERAGRFKYEHTYVDPSGIQFTLTNGGALPCKTILFSNWISSSATDADEQQLRKSIEVFLTKSMEYISKDHNPTSVAFTVCDSCRYETILVEEMITVAKNLLESKNLHTKIIFLLLPEQQSLRKHFCTLLHSIQTSYTHLEWITAVIKVTLISSRHDYLIKYQKKIQNYLKQCSSTLKIVHPNKLFSNWNQSMISAFYRYCLNQNVFPQIDKRRENLKLVGSMNNVLQVEQKFTLISMNSSVSCERLKVHRIMVSFCREDKRLSQRLVNRLTDEGFSVWAPPIDIDQHRDSASRMDKADCIILCTSENSSRNHSSENEVNYAYRMNKLILPVKIQNDGLCDWQREVFHGKEFYHLFGSEHYFDLEFERMLIEISRQTDWSYVSDFQREWDGESSQNVQPPYYLTMEQRRSEYDMKMKRLMGIDRIDDKEMKNLIGQLQNVIDDIGTKKLTEKEQKKRARTNPWKYLSSTEEFALCARRWLGNPSRNTKQNLPPFAPTGDINDALFPIPRDIFDDRDRALRTFLPLSFQPLRISSSRFDLKEEFIACDQANFIPTDNECIYGLRTQRSEADGNLFRIFSETCDTEDFIPRKGMNSPHYSMKQRPSNSYQRPMQISSRSRLSKKLQQARKPTLVVQKINHGNGSLTRKEFDVYKKKFAQLMHENVIQFEQFCARYTTVR